MTASPGLSAPLPSLVGRERELAALRAQLAAVLTGQGRLVLISGEAGIGKTALAEAVCAEAQQHGARVLVGRCYNRAETPAYGPWTEALSQAPPGPGSLSGRIPSLPDALRTAQQFFTAVRASFAAAAATQPLVLVLDDLQWADPASLDLLRFLARSLATLPLLLIVIYRSEDLDPRHPLSHLIPLLVREARAERLDLAPLAADALRTLVRGRYRLGTADESRLVAYLAQRTEGNALFVSEMLRALEERGRVGTEGGSLGELEAVSVPSMLRQIVVGRVERLGGAAAELLAIAAVIGQQMPLALWAMVTGEDEGTIERVAEQGLAVRLLVETRDGGEVAFAHALIREALYEALPAMRRRRLHRAVGEALAVASDAVPDTVAYHFRVAGDARAAAWLTRAGWRAYRTFAQTTARARFSEALPGMEGSERVRVLLALATLDRYHERGMRYAAEAIDAAHAAGDAVLAAMAQFRLGMTQCYRGHLGAALTQTAAAMHALDSVPDHALPEFDGIRGLAFPNRSRKEFRAFVLAYSGRWDEVFALLGGALETVMERVGSLDPNGSSAVWYACVVRGHLAEARRAAAAAIGVFVTTKDPGAELALRVCEGATLLLPFFLDDPAARERYDAEVQVAARKVAEEAFGAVPLHLNRCPLLIAVGRWEEAQALWAQRHDTATTTDLAWNLPHIGAMARARGAPDAAWALLGEGLPDGLHTVPGTTDFTAVDLYCLAARLALDAGAHAQARQWLEAHNRWLDWAGPEVRWGRANGQLAWAEYHRAIGDPALALRHAQQAFAAASAPRQPLALLAAHRLLGALATEAGSFAAAAESLHASLTLADACGAPYERALTLLAMAELHRATGDTAAAQRVLAETSALCTPLGAQPILTRAERLAERLASRPAAPAAYPAGLSVRQVEVLRLLAAGRTNAQIAAALSLSVRTVERHLDNLYRKIDVHGRSEATAFAFRHGLT